MKSFDVISAPLAGIQLIDASAGTGKTHTISEIVLRLLLEKGYAIRDILIVTYTEAATEELRAKVRRKLIECQACFATGDADGSPFFAALLVRLTDHDRARQQLKEALQGFDEAAVFTIHGFCQRMLWENNLETGTLFDTELVTEDAFLLEEIADDFIRLHLYESSELFVQYSQSRLQPGLLLLLLKSHLAKPNLRIIPEIDPMTAAQAALELEKNFVQAFIEARGSWPAAREQVIDLFTGGVLKGNIYRPRSIPAWIAAMDCLLTGEPKPELFDKFEKFTTAAVNGGIKKGNSVPDLAFFETCNRVLQERQLMTVGFDRLILALKREFFAYVSLELKVRKKQRNIHCFDDLLTTLAISLETEDGRLARAILQKFPVAMIDEFQDTDPVQYRIFEKIYGAGRGLLFLIGDPKQSIYGFRGADIFTYIRAAGKAANRATLARNWRSSTGLIKAINSLFGRVTNPFLLDAIEFTRAEPAGDAVRKKIVNSDSDPAPLQLWFIGREGDASKPMAREPTRRFIAGVVAGEVAKLLQSDAGIKINDNDADLLPGHIAVLVRTNRQARMIQQSLTDYGVPSVLHGSGSVFATREASELELVLSAIAEPAREHLLKTALATEMLCVPGHLLDSIEQGNDPLAEWRQRFQEYHWLWQTGGFIRMFRELLDREQVRTRLLAYPEGERRLTNVLHLSELLHRGEKEEGAGMTRLLFRLRERLTDAGRMDDEEHQLRLESDADRVKIVTIHKAKGLQYPVVFCPFSWEGPLAGRRQEFCFHEQTNGDVHPVLDLGSEQVDDHMNKARREDLAEDLRLLYVAITRAELRCYLLWGAISGADGSGLASLLHRVAPSSGTANSDPQMKPIATMSDSELLDDLHRLAALADGAIAVHRPEPALIPQAKDVEVMEENGGCRSFTGRIVTNWKITSFSSLAAQQRNWSSDQPDRNQNHSYVAISQSKPDAGKLDIFHFPAGATAGSFMHDLLEHLDFTADTGVRGELVAAKLAAYGYDSIWQPAIERMIDNLLAIELNAEIPGLKLGKIQMANRLTEMEFYFPLQAAGVELTTELEQIFNKGDGDTHRELTVPDLTGFMKGFIDLVFEFDGKYYLVDWKSNLLGTELDSYKTVKLDAAMISENYVLQYHIYVVALASFLASRLPDYSYEKHFGGVFYLFLRGVDKNMGAEYGVYYDLPDPNLVRRLQDLLRNNHQRDVKSRFHPS